MPRLDQLMQNSSDLHYSVFAHDGWMKWVGETWGLVAEEVTYTQDARSMPRLHVVLYLDKHGRVRMPPQQAYLPMSFVSDATRIDKRTSNWLELAGKLANDIKRRGVVGRININPGMLDARPFRWAGFETDIRYTYTTALPLAAEAKATNIRKRLKVAARLGLYAERDCTLDEVVECLNASGSRQGFAYKMTVPRLESLLNITGPDFCRVMVVRNENGTALSAGVRLFAPNATAIDWLHGTKQEGLDSGANQFLYQSALDDLFGAGANTFDFGGANIQMVAEAKRRWGMELTPYISLEANDLRRLRRTVVGFLRRISANLAKTRHSIKRSSS